MSSSNDSVNLQYFASREIAASAAADQLADCVRRDLEEKNTVSLVLSGGNTPKRCLSLLAKKDLAWSRVQICLTDERCVDIDRKERNARMLQEHFFNIGAADAQFFDLTETGLAQLHKPFSAVLVGMGEDGHFASIFPDIEKLDEALDPNSAPKLLDVVTAASPVQRVSMSLSLLLQSKQIVLLAFGDFKRAILEDPNGYPVAALLRQTQSPLRVVWAP